MEPRRSALIIAADRYEDPKLRQLRAPVHDAGELARVLADDSIGAFDVDVLLNEPDHKVRRRLAQFFANRARDDLLIVHFSCHGVKDDDGSLYFAAPDTEMEHLDSTAVPSEFVRRQMQKSRARRIALFLDCCFSGAFSRGALARAGSGVEIGERFDGRGQVVITASDEMEYAFEGEELTGEGRPSYFTTALVEGLATGAADIDGDDLVSIDELYDYVYERVREQTPNQNPTRWGYVQGELYIARNPKPRPVTPAELPAELKEALESPLSGVRGGAVSELERVLTGTNARLAAAAALALEAFADDDSRAVSDAAKAALARAAQPLPEQPKPDTPPPEPPATPPPPPPRWKAWLTYGRARKRRLALVAGVGATAAVVAGVLAVVLSPEERESAASGASWERLAAFETSETAAVYDVVDAGSRLVAVGFAAPEADKDARAWTSRDGQTWTPVDVGAGGQQEMHAVVQAGPGLVAVGTDFSQTREEKYDAAAWTSSDGGASWQPAPRSTSLGGEENQVMNAVALGSERLVAAGSSWENGSFEAAVWTSESKDGSVWTRVADDEFGGRDNQVIQSVASTDDASWTSSQAGSAGWFVAVGYDNDTKNAAVWISRDDGNTWSRVDDLDEPDNQQMRDVAATKFGWTAVGWEKAPGSDKIAAVWTAPPSGRVWTRLRSAQLDSSEPQEMRTVAEPSPGVLVAGGYEELAEGKRGAVWTSRDRGAAWTRASLPEADSGGGEEVYETLAVPSGMIAVGRGTLGKRVYASAWATS